MRCTSPICIINKEGIRGREFTPPEDAQGISANWCSPCIRLYGELSFYAQQTADMIRSTLEEYRNTDLPKEVLLILEQFTREILTQLNSEL